MESGNHIPTPNQVPNFDTLPPERLLERAKALNNIPVINAIIQNFSKRLLVEPFNVPLALMKEEVIDHRDAVFEKQRIERIFGEISANYSHIDTLALHKLGIEERQREALFKGHQEG